MRFTVVVMQVDGRITDRRAYTHAEVRGNGSGPDFAAGGHSLLAEKVPAVLTDTARFEVPIDPDGRLRLAWFQPTPHAAMATFGDSRRPLFTAAFLSGRGAWADFVAARTTEAYLADLPWARTGGAAITLPPDRPLTLLTPFPPTAAAGDGCSGGSSACRSLSSSVPPPTRYRLPRVERRHGPLSRGCTSSAASRSSIRRSRASTSAP